MKVILTEAPKGSDPGKIVQALADKGYKIEGFNDQPAPVTAPASTIGSRVSDTIKTQGGKVNDAIAGTGDMAGKSVAERGVRATAEAFKAVPEVAIDVMPAPVRNILGKIGNFVEGGFNAVVNQLADTQLFKDAAMSGQTHQLEAVLGTVAAGGDLAGSILAIEGGAKGIEKTATKVAEVAPKVAKEVSSTVKNLTTQSEASIENSILKKFEKGVKPTVVGKKTASGIQGYKDNVVSAVKSIKENAPNLTFTDEAGGAIIGQTPKTLQQLSDSIEQTKKTIFSSYDSLAKQAGEAGIGVEMSPIAKELDTVINSKSLSITNPKAIEYAKNTQARLVDAGKLDAVTAQEVIQNYNKSLEAFYRNPSYDNASNAAIDAMLANKVREELDKGISGLTGKQYGALKKQYGALKSIEKDVVKATLRDARKNVKGLIDFSDILSGGQVVNGILSLNPAAVGAGLTQKAISEFYKYLNNPNRAIEKMFSSADKLPVNPSK